MPSPAHRKSTKEAGSLRPTATAKAARGMGSPAAFPLPVSTAPMEARSATELPSDVVWQYEPKWDGFRCLAFKSGEEVDLRAKSGKPLGRFFPEIIALMRQLDAAQFVVDGELVIEVDGRLSFDALQMRLHPAASRVQKLSQQTPARLILFDMLVDTDGAILTGRPLVARRAALEAFAAENSGAAQLELSPFTLDRHEAERWLTSWEAGATDGVVAKRRDGPYECGERAMLKVKRLKTADCVVGGFRYESDSEEVGSLLLGLYDTDGTLNHVGFTATISDKERPALTRRLEALREPPGFTGKAPGGPSRWSTERSGEWEPVRPELVVEVRFDHVSSRRFRHGTKLMRWRPDKDPRQCTYEQIEPR
ncbi:ATP-dependent DNA ligase [Sinorhizobium fredii]|uniref:DNA ligase (ATP) n=1 Tax=Sinorhizobium fredii (strain USDA 257) TaxID=1185652 RepID=I3X6V0_SINF2|nr:ATP-dependent DNA ligase [Sinorhizobium fredii]AFL51606.1 putative DNA ligase [Sinorhizobium fredii USDA 257]